MKYIKSTEGAMPNNGDIVTIEWGPYRCIARYKREHIPRDEEEYPIKAALSHSMLNADNIFLINNSFGLWNNNNPRSATPDEIIELVTEEEANGFYWDKIK